MLPRRGVFDFHGPPPALQRIGAEPDAIAGPLGEAMVFDRDLSHYDAPEPVAARMVSVAVAIIAASLCLAFFMVLAIYGDSFIFILGSTMLQFSIPLVRGKVKGRFKSRLYAFNAFFLIVWTLALLPHGLLLIKISTNEFRSRKNFLENGACVIGIHKGAVYPAIILDIIINEYTSADLLGGSILDHYHRRRLAEGHGRVWGDYAPTTIMSQMVSSPGGGGGREASRRASIPPIVIIPPTPQLPDSERFRWGSLDITPTPLPTAYHGGLAQGSPERR
ncbi:hypothetical protein PG994_000497 [Apiospora phragmitis]|uniref:Uncharacterized protein n=1 Tax=Apiospora phragmitis TaxID=2905665 RepID=A0ABR1X6N3_9PEZI